MLFFVPVYAQAQNGVYFIPSAKQADSVHKVLAQMPNDTLKMSAYYYLSSYYTELNKDSAEYYGELQLDMAKRLHQKLWAADALFQVAYITYGLSNFPKSLTSITEGLAICADEASEKNNWKVSTFSHDGNPHRARLFIAAALHQIFAFLYINVGDSPKAVAQFLTAVKIAESVDDEEELSLDDMSLGGKYIEENKPDSALLLENRSLEYAYKSNYKIYLGTILNITGDIYLTKKDYITAGKYYQRAVQASISQNNLKDEIGAFLSVAKLQRTTGKLDSSLFYAREALKTAKKFRMSSEESPAYSSLFAVFKRMNKTDSAFAYLQLAKSLDDSLNDAANLKTNQYQRLNLNEQIRQREAEKAKIESENKTRVYVLLAGIGVLLLIAFLLYWNSQNRKKANDLLQLQKQEIGEQKEKVESTLAELKNTQKQLIQSEKMASLGELTAGIAHEIQNPLNFVNNFSEVSNELIDEMKEELTKGDIEEARLIAGDIKQNLEKITQHGKRADAIVKGMLQHSRQTKSIKELADINALCDECLNLSYHGLRAKDKSFNTQIQTDFDNSIGKINIVSQSIGRVLLNIIGNAFYATDQRHKAEGEQFKPLVSLQTKKTTTHIELAISDNGGGIPLNIIDKIFQPFFTTKPTGQGTGLGLSLAYDMITKEHDGTLEVKSVEGEGCTFVIRIPVG